MHSHATNRQRETRNAAHNRSTITDAKAQPASLKHAPTAALRSSCSRCSAVSAVACPALLSSWHACHSSCAGRKRKRHDQRCTVDPPRRITKRECASTEQDTQAENVRQACMQKVLRDASTHDTIQCASTANRAQQRTLRPWWYSSSSGVGALLSLLPAISTTGRRKTLMNEARWRTSRAHKGIQEQQAQA